MGIIIFPLPKDSQEIFMTVIATQPDFSVHRPNGEERQESNRNCLLDHCPAGKIIAEH